MLNMQQMKMRKSTVGSLLKLFIQVQSLNKKANFFVTLSTFLVFPEKALKLSPSNNQLQNLRQSKKLLQLQTQKFKRSSAPEIAPF